MAVLPRFQHTLPTLLASIALGASATAWAQNYPARPVRVLVPYAAGGSTDIQARIIAGKMGDSLKQSFIVENRPGAGATIGAAAVAHAAPDGYTIGVLTLPAASLVFNKTLPYDTDKDFTPITAVYRSEYTLAATTEVPAKNMQEFIAYAKANPGKLNYAVPAVTAQLTIEMLSKVTGIKMVPINYKGSAPSLAALRANEVQLSADLGGAFLPLVKEGKLRILAVTGTQRIQQLPDTPTLAELGIQNMRAANSLGMWGPAGLTPAMVTTLNGAAVEAIKSQELSSQVLAFGATPTPGTPEQLRERYKVEIEFWREAAKAANYQPD